MSATKVGKKVTLISSCYFSIKGTRDLLNKIKNINARPENAILVARYVVGPYSSVPHEAALEELREALDKKKTNKVSTGKRVKMTEFVLRNNYFQFPGKVYRQLLPLLIHAYLWIKWSVSWCKLKSFNLLPADTKTNQRRRKNVKDVLDWSEIEVATTLF